MGGTFRFPNKKPKRRKNKPRKSGAGNKFPSSVRDKIKKRDHARCVKCHSEMVGIHHIKPRREGGKGTEKNGICVCQPCHNWMDNTPEGRLWAEKYKERL